MATRQIVHRPSHIRATGPGISPIGYYRLGQSYPRSHGRHTYPRFRRSYIITSVLVERLNLRLKLGGLVLIGTGDFTPPSGARNAPWMFEGEFVVRSTGTSGTGVAVGELDDGTNARLLGSDATLTVNTTKAANLAVSAQWAVADALNSITVRIVEIERASI